MRHVLLLLWVVCASTFCTVALAQQERRVTGKVISADDGNGLPGVSVVAKGTSSNPSLAFYPTLPGSITASATGT